MTTRPLPIQNTPPTRLSRRAFLRAATSAAAGMALSACLPHPSNGVTETASGVQIVYQDWSTPWFPPMAQQMLGQFNTDHPDVQVFYVPDPDNVEEQLIVDMRAGNAPDVFQSCCTTFPIVGQAGYALDLRPYVARDIDQATIDDWDPAQYRSLFLPDGTQFGLPKYHGALALYYNKDAFDAFGVITPTAPGITAIT